MLGGDPESEISRAHATELLETASADQAAALADAASPPRDGTKPRRGRKTVARNEAADAGRPPAR
jgi:hypothetical protein